MVDALVASAIEALLGLEVGAAGQTATNRFSLEGLTFSAERDGALVIGIRTCEAASLCISSGPLVLEVGRVALNQIAGKVRLHEGRPRLHSLEAADAELSGVKVQGPLIFPRDSKGNSHASHARGSSPPPADSVADQAAVGAWCLGPLAALEGTIRAEITDAALLFDADVTLPIRQGQIDFNETTVEHVGPDSSMGVSRLGLYVDAPNGRSYLYQFSSVPVAGVEFEQRGGGLLGSRVADRGRLRLRALGEGMLLQGAGGPGLGFTDQARLLFLRTAVSGDVRLSDGRFATPALKADLVGRASDYNAVRFKSEAVGRGLTVEMAALCVRDAVLNARDARLACDQITGRVMLRVIGEGAQLGFAFNVANMKISGLRLQAR